jgi:hypothetical protein
MSLKDGWSVEGLAAKTFDGCGMLFMPYRQSPYYSFMIYSVTDNGSGTGTIIVKGDVGCFTGPYAGIEFTIAYGQALNQVITYEGSSIGENVLFFDNTSDAVSVYVSDYAADNTSDDPADDTYSFAHDDGFGSVGEINDSIPNGICQVCHTDTRHWRNDGSKAENYYSGEKGGIKTMQLFLALVKKIKSAILDNWEMILPKRVFVPVQK